MCVHDYLWNDDLVSICISIHVSIYVSLNFNPTNRIQTLTLTCIHTNTHYHVQSSLPVTPLDFVECLANLNKSSSATRVHMTGLVALTWPVVVGGMQLKGTTSVLRMAEMMMCTFSQSYKFLLKSHHHQTRTRR